MTHRVLVDLSHAADGYVGMAQDIRMLFAMLAEMPDVELTGLLMPLRVHDLPRLRGEGARVALAAGVLHWMSAAVGPHRHRSRLAQLRNVVRVLAARHRTVPMPEQMLDGIWRVLFQQTLPPSARAFSSCNSIRSRVAWSISGPTSVPAARGSPILRLE